MHLLRLISSDSHVEWVCQTESFVIVIFLRELVVRVHPLVCMSHYTDLTSHPSLPHDDATSPTGMTHHHAELKTCQSSNYTKQLSHPRGPVWVQSMSLLQIL